MISKLFFCRFFFFLHANNFQIKDRFHSKGNSSLTVVIIFNRMRKKEKKKKKEKRVLTQTRSQRIDALGGLVRAS